MSTDNIEFLKELKLKTKDLEIEDGINAMEPYITNHDFIENFQERCNCPFSLFLLIKEYSNEAKAHFTRLHNTDSAKFSAAHAIQEMLCFICLNEDFQSFISNHEDYQENAMNKYTRLTKPASFGEFIFRVSDYFNSPEQLTNEVEGLSLFEFFALTMLYLKDFDILINPIDLNIPDLSFFDLADDDT